MSSFESLSHHLLLYPGVITVELDHKGHTRSGWKWRRCSCKHGTESLRGSCPTSLDQQLAWCNTIFLWQRSLNPSCHHVVWCKDNNGWFFQLKRVRLFRELQGTCQVVVCQLSAFWCSYGVLYNKGLWILMSWPYGLDISQVSLVTLGRVCGLVPYEY